MQVQTIVNKILEGADIRKTLAGLNVEEEIAVIQNGPVKYTGYDPADNGKRWTVEKGNRTYVYRQKDEFSQQYIPVVAYDSEYLEKAKKSRDILPPFSVEDRIENGETAFYFFYDKAYWVFSKEEAIKFIYDQWDKEEKRSK